MLTRQSREKPELKFVLWIVFDMIESKRAWEDSNPRHRGP